MELPAMVLVVVGAEGPQLCSDPRAPFLRADDLGVLRGDGVFERFLVVAGRSQHLGPHLERLYRSARQVDLEVPGEQAWRAAVGTAIRAWQGSEEWEMRLVCTRGPEEGGLPSAYVLGQELAPAVREQRKGGIRAVTLERGFASGLGAGAPWLLLGAKTLSYAVNVASRRWARRLGADEVVFVGPDGFVWESGTSSVVVAFGKRLVSPSPSIGILDSISVAQLFAAAEAVGWETARDNLEVADLFAADGLWLCSSLRFARVHTLDGKALPAAAANEELARLAVGG
ncbi:MAG: aminotransferase class IV [Acidimicrobiales bacterium]